MLDHQNFRYKLSFQKSTQTILTRKKGIISGLVLKENRGCSYARIAPMRNNTVRETKGMTSPSLAKSGTKLKGKKYVLK